MELSKINSRFGILLSAAFVVIGAIYSLPHIIHVHELAKQGQPYFAWTQEGSFDMFNVHAARYQGLIDGDGWLKYDDTAEYQGGPSVWPLLSAAIFAPFMWLTKSVSTTIIITDGLFAMLIFGAWFWLFSNLLANRPAALFSAFVLMLFPQLPLLIPPSSLDEFRQIINPWYDVTYWRREAFIPAAPFFIMGVYFIYQLVAKIKHQRRHMVWAGVSYGLLFYFYFYFWSYLTVVLGLLFLAMLLIKRRIAAWRIFSAGLIGLLVSGLFWLNQYELMQLPQYQEIIERGGLEVGQAFRFGLWKTYFLYAGMAGLALWFGRKLKSPVASILVAVLLAANIIVLNIQLITGFNVQSDHWPTRVFLLSVGISWVVIAFYTYQYFEPYLSRFRRVLPVLGIIISIALVSNVVYRQFSVERTQAAKYTVDNSLLKAYNWMRENLPAGSVVATPALATNIDLPVFTNHKLFMARSQTSIASEQEIISRMLITYKLFALKPSAIAEALAKTEGILYFFTARYENRALDRYLDPEKYHDFSIPPELLADILSRYQELSVPNKLPYRLDYLFVGPAERALGVAEAALSDYKLLYNTDGIQIYKYE